MSVDVAAQEAAEEAAWALETAETLRARGDLEGARSWYLRAADHLMDAGDDDRALEIAKLAASLAESQASVSQMVPAVRAQEPAVTPAVTPAVMPVAAPFPKAASINAPPPEPAPSPFPPAISVPAPPAHSVPPPAAIAPSAVPPRPAPSTESRGSTPPREALVWRADRAAAAERLWARLLALPLFQDLASDRLRALARHVTVVQRGAGESLLAAAPFGEVAQDTPLLVITDGAASLRAHGARLPSSLSAGDTVGEAGALYGGPSLVDVVADGEVTAVAFAPSLVRALAREFEGFRGALEEAAWERAFGCLGYAAPLLRYAPEARAQLYARFEPVALRAGEILLAEGDEPSAVWLVAAGEVEVYGGTLDPLGVWRARAGDALGVEASAGGGPSGVSARALRDVLAARVTPSAFRELVAAHPALRGAIDVVGVAGRAVIC